MVFIVKQAFVTIPMRFTMDSNLTHKICNFIVVVTITTHGFSQPNVFTVEELKQGFYDQYTTPKKDSLIGEWDRYFEGSLNYPKEGDLQLDSVSHNFIFPSDALHTVGKYRLPPSDFVCLGIFDSQTHSFSEGFYWIGTRYHQNTPENLRLKKYLKKKYGYLSIGRDSILVPAKWFTGHFTALTKPFEYGHTVIAESWLFGDVDMGEFHSEKGIHPVNGGWRRPSGLESAVMSIARTNSNGTIHHTTNTEQASSESLSLFARDINRLIDKQLIPMEMKKEYSVMLYLDKSEKAHLYPLIPRELTDADRLLLTLLSNAIEQQPVRTFGGYFSDRGFFPAIYLRARYFMSNWSFEDYRFIEQ